MCKGVAILINDKEILMNEENSSHSYLGVNEDNYLKINLVFDNTIKRGYRFEVDAHTTEQLENYKKKAYLNEKGKIISSYMKRLKKFCKENEAKIFRLFASGLLQNAKLEFQDNKYGDIQIQANNKGKIHVQNNMVCKIITQHNAFADIKNQNNYRANIRFQEDQCVTLNNILIRNMKLRDSKKYTKLIKEFSKTKQKKYTFTSFCDWLLRNKR